MISTFGQNFNMAVLLGQFSQLQKEVDNVSNVSFSSLVNGASAADFDIVLGLLNYKIEKHISLE